MNYLNASNEPAIGIHADEVTLTLEGMKFRMTPDYARYIAARLKSRADKAER